MPGRRPTWGQVRRFCERQGFRQSTTDHAFYDKVLPDGSTAGTKISFGLAETEPVPASLWPRVWKRQLRLRAAEEFWRGLEGGPVAYDLPPAAEPAQPLPDYLVRHLREDRHLSDDAIAALPRAEAQRLLNEWYSRDRGEP
jgi:hypothetical protein